MAKKREGTQKCTSCGRTYEKHLGFYLSASEMYKENEGRMHICKECVVKMFDRFVEHYGDEEKALYRVTLLLDGYFDNNILNIIYANARKTNSNLARVYFQKINALKQYKTKTSFDSMKIMSEDDLLIGNESVDKKVSTQEESFVTTEMLRRWGKGLVEEDYIYLEEKYQELIAVYDHKSPVQRMLYENMSRTQLEAEKARRNGNLVAYEKMMTTLSKLMADGNIKPVQESSVSDDDASFGNFINKIENEEPIPEPLEFFKDVDNFRKYVTEWFVKPFARVFELDSDSVLEEDEDDNEN